MAKRVLCIGRSQQIMDAVLAQFRSAGYDAEGAVDVDAVVDLATGAAFDALLIGGGVQGDDRAEVIERVTAIQAHIAIVPVSGPATALAELREAIGEP